MMSRLEQCVWQTARLARPLINLEVLVQVSTCVIDLQSLADLVGRLPFLSRKHVLQYDIYNLISQAKLATSIFSASVSTVKKHFLHATQSDTYCKKKFHPADLPLLLRATPPSSQNPSVTDVWLASVTHHTAMYHEETRTAD